MKKKQMTDILRAGGIKTELFDEYSPKPLDKLLREINGCDATLTLAEINGRVWAVRSAFSVKVVITSTAGYLCEVARKYERGEPIALWKPFGLSGTRKREELPDKAVIDEFWEEQRRRVKRTELKGGRGEVENLHESSAYGHRECGFVLSKTHEQYYRYHATKPFGHERPVSDDGIFIFHEWFQFKDLSPNQQRMIRRAEQLVRFGPAALLYAADSLSAVPQGPFEL